MDDQKPKCPNHPDKESAFYCFNHSIFACLKCVAVHIQCQVENQFHPLEEIFENLQHDVFKEKEVVSQRLKDYATQIQENNHKLTVLETLKSLDIQSIQDYFEDMKKKAELIKQKAIQNYETCYSSVLEKVASNNQSIAQRFNMENQYFSKIEKFQDTLKGASTVDEKRAKSVEMWKELEGIKREAVDIVKFQTLDHELEILMGREEVFSEIGNMTLAYNGLSSKVADFMEEHMETYVKDPNAALKEEQITKESESKKLDNFETLDDKISKIEYLKEEKHIYEDNFLKVLEDTDELEVKASTRLHQLRYCSNEVNVFDTVTRKFTCYQLYTTNTYKAPFLIFNNCCSALHKNHLVFLFGGEDPACNDKSSNRVFCFNLDHATEDKKVVVYEISQMSWPRSEFTICTLGNSIYVISGYDSNKTKEFRVIPKCERLDIKSKKFYDMRDINYPRQAACSVNVNNTHVYVFGGQNPKYLNTFVDKIERYALNLNDWTVVKYSVMNEFAYEPGMNSTAFRLNEGEIVILGGQREFDMLNGFYVFDMKKLLFVKKEEEFFEEADNFYNQNDVAADKEGCIRLFSSNMANYVYEIRSKDAASYTLGVNIVEDENAGDYK